MRATKKKPEPWREHGDAVAGALMCLGSMLCQWGLPITKAITGLRAAYKIEQEKQRDGDNGRSE